MAKRRRTDQPPLICHIIYKLAVGGLENGLVNLINRLPQDAYQHAIICITEATDFRARIQRPDVKIFELHKRPGKDFPAYARMWQVLRELKPRLVHTRNLPALDMLVPARLAGVNRFVHSEHGLDLIEIDGKNRKYNRLRRLSRVVVNHYITVSADLNRWLEREIGVPKALRTTIYNGVDTLRFSPDGPTHVALPPGFADEQSIVIGAIGRLDPLKNQAALVEAFLRILQSHPDLRPCLRLALVGDGPERPRIQAALEQARVTNIAWISGFRDDMPQLYRSIDIFVLPSRREGISNTLLEAMASGIPVIATRVGGNPEILPEEVAGQLVAPEPDPLAAAIVNYLQKPPLRALHGKAGRDHVLRSFSLERMVTQYDNIYRGLI